MGSMGGHGALQIRLHTPLAFYPKQPFYTLR